MAKLSLFCCGGAGINLGSTFLSHIGKTEEGFAEIVPFFLDTSRSNLSGKESEDHVYIIDGVDGSGKKRDSNYRLISERSKEMLHRFKPTDVNVVIHSASGGSGSVIGPVLVSELLSRDAPTIVIMVGSTDSSIEARNTMNTLKSYEVISSKRETPVIAVYYENSKDTPRGQVDARIQTTIVILSAIFSGQNRELDSADLANFLNYPAVTSFSPQLSYLDFFTKEIQIERGQSAVTVVSLTDNQTDSSVDLPIEYQAVGFVTDNARNLINADLPIHAVIISGYYHNTIDRLEKRLEAVKEARGAFVERSIAASDTNSTEEGLVL